MITSRQLQWIRNATFSTSWDKTKNFGLVIFWDLFCFVCVRSRELCSGELEFVSIVSCKDLEVHGKLAGVRIVFRSQWEEALQVANSGAGVPFFEDGKAISDVATRWWG